MELVQGPQTEGARLKKSQGDAHAGLDGDAWELERMGAQEPMSP